MKFLLIGDANDLVKVYRNLQLQFQKTWANRLVLQQLYPLRLKDRESVQEHSKVITELFNVV